MDDTPKIVEAPRAQPLYAQVRARMMQRLIAGQWRPGEMLPSEFRLADLFGVSQGTVRKALDALAADNVVVRRQGRGTFVAEHDQHRALFHFFHLFVNQFSLDRTIMCQNKLERIYGALKAHEYGCAMTLRNVL